MYAIRTHAVEWKPKDVEKTSIIKPIKKEYKSKNHFEVPIGKDKISIIYRNGLM